MHKKDKRAVFVFPCWNHFSPYMGIKRNKHKNKSQNGLIEMIMFHPHEQSFSHFVYNASVMEIFIFKQNSGGSWYLFWPQFLSSSNSEIWLNCKNCLYYIFYKFLATFHKLGLSNSAATLKLLQISSSLLC